LIVKNFFIKENNKKSCLYVINNSITVHDVNFSLIWMGRQYTVINYNFVFSVHLIIYFKCLPINSVFVTHLLCVILIVVQL